LAGAALGEPLVGAFLAVRRSDAQWAAERPLEEIISAHLWRY
jgi:glutamine synthetase